MTTCVVCVRTKGEADELPPVGQRWRRLCQEHEPYGPAVLLVDGVSEVGESAEWLREAAYELGAVRGVPEAQVSLVLRAYGFEEGA